MSFYLSWSSEAIASSDCVDITKNIPFKKLPQYVRASACFIQQNKYKGLQPSG